MLSETYYLYGWHRDQNNVSADILLTNVYTPVYCSQGLSIAAKCKHQTLNLFKAITPSQTNVYASPVV